MTFTAPRPRGSTPAAAGTGAGLGAGPDAARGLRSIRHLTAGLPGTDGVAIFTEAYRRTLPAALRTPRPGPAIAGGPAAGRPACPVTAGLGGRLVSRYAATLRISADGGLLPAGWRPLFQLRRHPGVRPLQFVLAGAHAHLGCDLPLALLHTARALDAPPETLEAACTAAGERLAAAEERLHEDFAACAGTLRVTDPLTHLAGSWSLARAHEGAWTAFLALWELRHSPGARDRYAAQLASGAGMVSRLLLTPLDR